MRGLNVYKKTAVKATLDKNHQTLLNHLNLKIHFFQAEHSLSVQRVFFLWVI
jgi:hypothetical protein